MSKKHLLFTLALAFAVAILSSLASIYLYHQYTNSPEQRLKAFYDSEMSAVVSPASLKKSIDEKKTDYVLVDLRSQGEYEKEHFVTAINIPAGSMNEEQLVAAFKRLPSDKEIIVHCYSAYCTLGRQVGEALAKNGIYVKELTVGWSELRYHWDLWNPGAGVEDGKAYITTGQADPTNTPIIPCTEGVFGC